MLARMFRNVACSLLAATSIPSAGGAQDHGVGAWDPPILWEHWIAERDPADSSNQTILFEDCDINPNKIVGQGNEEWELSHAAVIPTGDYAGWVVMWRLEAAVNPSGAWCDPPEHPAGCFGNTSKLWAIDPASPDVPVAILHDFDSDVFCAGQSWDKVGQLVIAGGVPGEDELGGPWCPPEPGLGDFPAEAYRFKPSALGIVQFPPSPVPPPPGGYFAGTPFFPDTAVIDLDDGVIGRYYPLVMPLFELVSYYPGVVSIPGACNLLIGGPPGIGDYGNEVWELIRPRTASWEPPMIPQDPNQDDGTYGSTTSYPLAAWIKNSPLYNMFPNNFPLSTKTYERDASSFPDRLLDSYPRMYQLPGGEVLIWGDVDTGPMGANLAGMTWTMQPDLDADISELDGWKSALGTTGSGNTGGGVWHDSFYGSGVLLQELDAQGTRQARVLAFGGSRNVGGAPPNDSWLVNDEVWQFSAEVGSPTSVSLGAWHLKFEDVPTDLNSWFGPGGTAGTPYPAFKRMFANAVILPTGEVFFVGGTSVDDHAGQGGHAEGPTAPVAPIIYDPGLPDPGQAFAQLDGTVYEQPSTYGASNTPILPRLYHSTAVLLADGRVLTAGGKRTYGGAMPPYNQLVPSASGQLGANDPRYSGQIFSPPYLDLEGTGFGSRPVLEEPPSPIDFGLSFEIEVTRLCERIIDTVVLIRPAAVTHHFDQDQRYVELAFTITSTSSCSNGEDANETLEVTAPDADEVPPGYYMMFVVESDQSGEIGHRVPSVGRFVRLR